MDGRYFNMPISPSPDQMNSMAQNQMRNPNQNNQMNFNNNNSSNFMNSGGMDQYSNAYQHNEMNMNRSGGNFQGNNSNFGNFGRAPSYGSNDSGRNDNHGPPSKSMLRKWAKWEKINKFRNLGEFVPKKNMRPYKKQKLTQNSTNNVPIHKRFDANNTMENDKDEEELPETKGINVAVIPEDYPGSTLDEEQMVQIQNFIIDKIDTRESGTKPSFYSSTFDNDYILFDCFDQHTKTWLEGLFQTESPIEDTKLKVINSTEIPTFTEITIYIPDTSVEISKILTRLQNQNVGITTRKWKILHSLAEANGITMFLAIDDHSFGVIKKAQFKLGYKFTRVTVEIIGTDSSQDSIAQSPDRSERSLSPPPAPQYSENSSKAHAYDTT